eukprot:5639665-Amphidinium_carterae.1
MSLRKVQRALASSLGCTSTPWMELHSTRITFPCGSGGITVTSRLLTPTTGALSENAPLRTPPRYVLHEVQNKLKARKKQHAVESE